MNKQEFLAELKTHDWTYSYASGDAYRKGKENQDRLKALASEDEELQALYGAYSKFVWEGGEEPTIEEKAAPAAAQQASIPKGYNRSAIMKDAWNIARKAAKRFGGNVKSFISAALCQAWAKAKAKALSSFQGTEQTTPAYFICIDEKLDRNTRLINKPVIDQVFTDQGEAYAALQILSGAFQRPFIKTSRYFHP